MIRNKEEGKVYRSARHPCPDGRILTPVKKPVNSPDCFPFVFAFPRSLSYLDKQLAECYHTSQQGKGVLRQDALPFYHSTDVIPSEVEGSPRPQTTILNPEL